MLIFSFFNKFVHCVFSIIKYVIVIIFITSSCFENPKMVYFKNKKMLQTGTNSQNGASFDLL